jgi:geranylgeranyl reductase family protein
VTAPRHLPSRVGALVVGAGPAGTAAAITLARGGSDVLVLDKAHFPRDKCCGDGLTTGALRRLEALEIDPAEVPSWRWVDDVLVGGPKGHEVRYPLPRDGHFAAVATRYDLDAALLRRARGVGAQVFEGAAVTNAAQHSDGVRVHVEGHGMLVADRLIAADGMWSPVRKALGTTSPKAEPKVYLGEWHAYRQYFSNVRTEASKQLCVWFEPDLVPGYVWCFPLAGGRVNVGFGIERRADVKTHTMKALWAALLERPHIRAVLGADAVPEDAPKAWPIPAAIIHAPLSDGRVLYAGDAARACDVLTGEGIGQALQTGSLAAEAILAHPRHPRRTADRYEEDVLAQLGPDHRMAQVLQRMIRSAPICRAALRISGASDWTRTNFARWLFEDYARGIALTPTRWRWGLMSGTGAYAGVAAVVEP